ncbi:MAG TPA: threonine/serine exporter family protein, partial [Ornithinibacter sp.]|nr:threonine/serine exporter family protein [Ornithinibacter sp.]
LSAFVGALVMTPVAVWAARHPSGPPALVSFMPAFWLLVPGALGLLGLTKYLGEDRVYGAASLTTAGATMVAIALGVLLGLTAASALADREGPSSRTA